MTTNPGKFREVQEQLAVAGIPLERVDRPYPEIQTTSLAEVLEFARHHLDREVGGDYLADDSGLFVSALGGFPGVYSAHAYRTLGCKGLLRLLEGKPDRSAEFRSAFLVAVGGHHTQLTGTCRGTIAATERGTGGFGYDPIFVPEGSERTFAEMSTEEKNVVSHRGRAVQEVIRFLKSIRVR